MAIFTKIKESVSRATERAARARVRQELLQMSDWQLTELGFSRALLLEGINCWPWHISTDTNEIAQAAELKNVDSQSATSRSSINQAINELSSYSDRELAELGITRHGIEEAVLYGRPAPEYEPQQHAA